MKYYIFFIATFFVLIATQGLGQETQIAQGTSGCIIKVFDEIKYGYNFRGMDYPNPFSNGHPFSISDSSHVRIAATNLSTDSTSIICDEILEPGLYLIVNPKWGDDSHVLPSGSYSVTLEALPPNVDTYDRSANISTYFRAIRIINFL